MGMLVWLPLATSCCGDEIALVASLLKNHDVSWPGFGKAGDVLIVFTTSGNSQNIVRALEEAKKRGVFSIAFLGKGGGKCKDLADIDIIVPGTKTTARIQEVHHFLLHVICEGVEKHLK